MTEYKCACGHWATSHDDEQGHGTGCLDCSCTKTHQDVMNDPGSESVEEGGGSGRKRRDEDGSYGA